MRSPTLIIAALLLAGCASDHPLCLDRGEAGVVVRISKDLDSSMQSMSLRLNNGMNRICWVPNGAAKSIEPGDRFVGPLGGGDDYNPIHGER